MQGSPRQAMDAARRALELRPGFYSALEIQYLAAARLGDMELQKRLLDALQSGAHHGESLEEFNRSSN
jgi:hypothetical protein